MPIAKDTSCAVLFTLGCITRSNFITECSIGWDDWSEIIKSISSRLPFEITDSGHTSLIEVDIQKFSFLQSETVLYEAITLYWMVVSFSHFISISISHPLALVLWSLIAVSIKILGQLGTLTDCYQLSFVVLTRSKISDISIIFITSRGTFNACSPAFIFWPIFVLVHLLEEMLIYSLMVPRMLFWRAGTKKSEKMCEIVIS